MQNIDAIVELLRSYFKGPLDSIQEKSVEKLFLPGIIISDMNLDCPDGITLCWTIKQDSSLCHIPIILIAVDETCELKPKVIETGAGNFISKPLEKEMLIARVNGILRNGATFQNYFYNEATQQLNIYHISDEDKEFLYKCVAIIENYMPEGRLDIQTIAEKLSISYSILSKKIKSITGQTVNSFIRFIRIRKAAELFISTDCNVNEVSMRVGISDVKYFRLHFVQVFGMRPHQFIKKHRGVLKNKVYKLRANYKEMA